jgi:hypothetical protein
MKTGATTFLTTPALSIDSPNGGVLDMTDEKAIVDWAGSSPIATIAKYVSTGWAGGAWTGAGITSTLAAIVAANAGNPFKTAVGFGEASALGIGAFAGQSLDGSAVLLRYTTFGDANLDGTVDSNDFAVISMHYNATGQLWYQGDFNFDGVVNAMDFNTIASNFGQVLPSAPPDAALAALVPEPLCLAGVLLFTTVARRRRNRSS